VWCQTQLFEAPATQKKQSLRLSKMGFNAYAAAGQAENGTPPFSLPNRLLQNKQAGVSELQY
jgi:hypothetical protein